MNNNGWELHEIKNIHYYISGGFDPSELGDYIRISCIYVFSINDSGKCIIKFDVYHSGGTHTDTDDFIVTDFDLDKYNYRFSIDHVDIPSSELVTEDQFPIEIYGDDLRNYPKPSDLVEVPIRIEKRLKGKYSDNDIINKDIKPDISLLINNNIQKYDNGWAFINNKKRQIDKIWTHINNKSIQIIHYKDSKICYLTDNNSIEIYKFDKDLNKMIKIHEIYPNRKDMIISFPYYSDDYNELYLVGYYKTKYKKIPYWEKYDKDFNLLSKSLCTEDFYFDSVSSFGVCKDKVILIITKDYARDKESLYIIDNKITGKNIYYRNYMFKYYAGNAGNYEIKAKPTFKFYNNDTRAIETFYGQYNQNIYILYINKCDIYNARKVGYYGELCTGSYDGCNFNFEFIKDNKGIKKDLLIYSSDRVVKDHKDRIQRFHLNTEKILWSIDIDRDYNNENNNIFIFIKNTSIGYIVSGNSSSYYKGTLKIFKIDLEKGIIIDTVDTGDSSEISTRCEYSNGYIYTGDYIFDDDLNIITKSSGLKHKNLYYIGDDD